ncbi:hypothetical protein JWR97_09105, partial [Pseudomonas cedrina subsp. fulgida]|nr:hypothetical protein [Pseudomonas cedrina subsp. fulgida]
MSSSMFMMRAFLASYPQGGILGVKHGEYGGISSQKGTEGARCRHDGTCDATDLRPQANPTALVSAQDGIAIDMVMKHRACTGKTLGVACDRKPAIVQTFAELGEGRLHRGASQWHSVKRR